MTLSPTDLPSTGTLLPPLAPVSLRAQGERPKRPVPLGSLVASARRLTSKTIGRHGIGAKAKGWQEDAWEMFDLVGEQRFLATTLAGRLSQARFYVGVLSTDDVTDTPLPVQDESIKSILTAVGGSDGARAQLVNRLGINLFVTGDGWLAGIPRDLMPESLLPQTGFEEPTAEELAPEFVQPGLNIDDLEWRMLSISEVSSTAGGDVMIKLGETAEEQISVNPDEVFLVRVWRSHPRRSWEADSPTRSSLPVLRELVGLTMHISAQVDSRLAGAGVFIVPASAKRALLQAAGLEEDSEEDPFTEALMEAMLTPIGDRGSASALVPLIVTVPDDAHDKFHHITFDKPLDIEARNLRDEAIRRLALGEDAPPELLLGTAGMNHWGAWLVSEDVVTTHLEPPLALICDALTTQYLWPVLLDMGFLPEDARRLVIWYDVSHMIVRPNRSADALNLHGRGAISDVALRNATGFDESDAPITDELPQEVGLALEMVKTSPGLLADPGLPQLVAQIRAVLTGDIPEHPSDPTLTAAPAVEATATEPGQPQAPGQPPAPGQATPPTPGEPSTNAVPEKTPTPAQVAAANERVQAMTARARARMDLVMAGSHHD